MGLENMSRVGLLPVGGILDRYIIRSFLRIFVISFSCAASLYLIVDFFDRIDTVLGGSVHLWASIRYFLYKLPLMISHVFGFAALFSTLFSLGMLSRNQEITAMRSSGLSLRRISLPLLLLSCLICIFTFFWNEALVPIFTRKSDYIYKTEIKKKQPQSLIGSKGIWMREEGSFVSVDYFDTKKNVLEGISIYPLNRDFQPRGLIVVPAARWNGKAWEAQGGTEWLYGPKGQLTQQKAAQSLPLSETPEDFRLVARDADEFSFFDLQKQIADLKAKGIDATEYEVDLQVKLVIPLISPLLVFLAIPFGTRHGAGGMALSFGLTMLISFGYWLLMAFSISLGHSAALPPWLAAWLPNTTLALVGLFFYTADE